VLPDYPQGNHNLVQGENEDRQAKPIYEKPVLIKLGEVPRGLGQSCNIGSAAQASCVAGTVPKAHCVAGTIPA